MVRLWDWMLRPETVQGRGDPTVHGVPTFYSDFIIDISKESEDTFIVEGSNYYYVLQPRKGNT